MFSQLSSFGIGKWDFIHAVAHGTLTIVSFGRDQTCSMLLGIASGNIFLEHKDGSSAGAINMLSPDIVAVAKQAFYDFGERPMWTERVTYGTSK